MLNQTYLRSVELRVISLCQRLFESLQIPVLMISTSLILTMIASGEKDLDYRLKSFFNISKASLSSVFHSELSRPKNENVADGPVRDDMSSRF